MFKSVSSAEYVAEKRFEVDVNSISQHRRKPLLN